MKLKYYLRGLGIGILITTIIFIIGIHVNQDQMFSDEEVIRRAKALGMVMDETDGKTINELDKDKKQDSESKDQKDSKKEDSKESRNRQKMIRRRMIRQKQMQSQKKLRTVMPQQHKNRR